MDTDLTLDEMRATRAQYRCDRCGTAQIIRWNGLFPPRTYEHPGCGGHFVRSPLAIEGEWHDGAPLYRRTD